MNANINVNIKSFKFLAKSALILISMLGSTADAIGVDKRPTSTSTTTFVASGRIGAIEVSSSGYDFRVYLVNVSSVCAGGSNFAYTIPSEANFNAYVSVILTAYSLGKNINIYTSLINGQCKITSVDIY